MDKLDVINRKKSMRSNMIKWWNVNLVPANSQEANKEEINSEEPINNILPINNELSSPNQDDIDLCDKILAENSRDNVYDKVCETMNADATNEVDDDVADRAAEIYNRLLMEAMEDENKKQQEINAAFEKQLAEGL